MSAEPLTTPPATDSGQDALRELAAKFPEPDWKASAADRYWLAEYEATGALDSMAGKVVAVLDQKIIGVGDDYVAMLLELSPKYDVPPGRIVVVGIDE